MTDEYQIDGKTWAEKDESGNISANVDSVNTENKLTYPDGNTVRTSPKSALSHKRIDPPPEPQPHPQANNPVLEAADVSDKTADGVADPFLVYDFGGKYHMLFEVIGGSGDNDIAHATSPDGLTWTYDQIVIDTTNSISSPFVTWYKGTWYMTPSYGSDASTSEFRIYSSTDLVNWTLEETPLTDSPNAINDSNSSQFTDPAIIKWDGIWYLLAFDGADDKFMVYVGGDGSPLNNTWDSHPANPLRSGSNYAAERTEGGPTVGHGYIEQYQNSSNGLSCHRITELTETAMSEVEVKSDFVTSFEESWASNTVGFFDPVYPDYGGAGLAAVDGADANGTLSIGIAALEPYGAGAAAIHHETGQISQSLAASSDATWDTAELATVSVTFDTAFNNTPRTAATVSNGNKAGNAATLNVTTTGMDVRVFNYQTSSTTLQADWVAIEQ